MLSNSDKEELFEDHISILSQKKKRQFQKLLEDTAEVSSMGPLVVAKLTCTMICLKANIDNSLEEG